MRLKRLSGCGPRLLLYWAIVVLGCGRAWAAASGPFEGASAAAPANGIDACVFSRLQASGLLPATLCLDPVFVRRVFLDVIGTLPTAMEAEQFILDRAPDKRGMLIDRLLGRDEFADYWAMKWGDLLRIKAEFPDQPVAERRPGLSPLDAACSGRIVPYDRFVRELLTASGSNFPVPQVNFYRAVQKRSRRPSRRRWL